MIHIYLPTNTNFDFNGDMTLFPTKCEINTSTWQMMLEHPIDGEGRWKYILEEGVIKAPSFNGDQLFRISKIFKSDSGIEVIAYPIFYDAKHEVFLESVHPTNKTGQEALDIMMEGTKFFGESDITILNTSYYERRNLLESLLGTDSNSFLNRWGGEVMFDNFKIIIKQRLGSDYGLSIKYGKNVQYDGFTETIDMDEVVTRIYPKAYNGRTLSSKYVDSTLIGAYPKVRLKEIEFSNIKLQSDATGSENDCIICADQEELDNVLIQKCNELYEQGLDKPKVSIKVDLVLLENTIAYEKYKNIESVHLGDTVYCNHDRLGIITTARVVNLVYDCLAKKVIKAEIGNHIQDYIEKTSNVIDSVNQVINVNNKTLLGEKIQGVIDLSNTSLRAQKDIAKKQEVRAILFEDLDPTSPTFGAMCLGTQGLEISKQRNETNTDWIWGTAINFESVQADAIIAGVLSGQCFSLNLDNGSVLIGNRDSNGEISNPALSYDPNNGLRIETTGTGKEEIVKSSSEPDDTTKMWLDTSVDPNILKYYNGNDWVMANDQSQQIQSSIDEAKLSITTEYSSAIKTVKDEIYLRVGSVETIVSEDGKKITDLETKLSVTDQLVQITKSTTETLQSAINGKVSQEELEEYVRFDGAKVEIGKSDSLFKTVITNEELAFYQGDYKVAWISNNELHVTNAIITTAIGVGKFIFKDEGDSGFSLMMI